MVKKIKEEYNEEKETPLIDTMKDGLGQLFESIGLKIDLSKCFPPNAVVHTPSGPISMKLLKVGTMVLNRSCNYEPVVAWLHKREQKNTQIEFEFEDNTTFTCSGNHLVWSPDMKKYIFASELIIGSQLQTTDGFHKIKSIENKVYDGYYAPLTLSGNIIVDTVHCSCYASTDHNLAHEWMKLSLPMVLDIMEKNGYTDMGFLLEPNMQDSAPGIGNFMNTMTEIAINL